jgi:hypothetical protein
MTSILCKKLKLFVIDVGGLDTFLYTMLSNLVIL